MLRSWLCHLFCTLAVAAAPWAQAGVTTERTRVIFPAGGSEVSMRVVNLNPYPVVVQTWIDDGALEGTPEKAISSFMSLPPVFSLLPSEHRTLRLISTGDHLPADRESLFWLNIYEIPPTPTESREADQQRLMVAMRTQIKLLYRPSMLPQTLAQAAEGLEFSLRAEGRELRLKIDNPSRYFITFSGLDIRQGRAQQSAPGNMVAPQSSLDVPLAGLVAGQGGEVRFNWIDDDGNSRQASAALR